jgi:antitoxin component of MazEF toxin-antitoxin module
MLYSVSEMVTMQSKLRKVGCSFVITIPPEILKSKGFKPGDYLLIPDDQIKRAVVVAEDRVIKTDEIKSE